MCGTIDYSVNVLKGSIFNRYLNRSNLSKIVSMLKKSKYDYQYTRFYEGVCIQEIIRAFDVDRMLRRCK